MADADDYDSSDDEDYVPEAGVGDIDDEPSGDEVDEVTAEDGSIVLGSRRKTGKSKKPEADKKEVAPSTSTEDADALFAAMLEDDDPILSRYKQSAKPSTELSSASISSVIQSVTDVSATPSTSYTHEVSSRVEDGSKTTTITEIFDFAGDEVKVQREITMDELREREEKAQQASAEGTSAKKPVQKRLGLGGALTMLAKKPKMSVLDKSNHDWSAFKAENNIAEELETFNRGKSGYLNKMDFLNRTDQREFENEKAMRAANRKPQ